MYGKEGERGERKGEDARQRREREIVGRRGEMKEDKEREETKTRGRDLRHPRGRDKGIAAAPARFSKTTLACVCSANTTHSHLSVCATYVPTTQPHPQPTQVRNLRSCKDYLMTTPGLACGRGEQWGAFWHKCKNGFSFIGETGFKIFVNIKEK